MATRKPIYDQLPDIWRRLDVAGVLERFLTGIEGELNAVHDCIATLARQRNLNEIPNKYLKLYCPFVGHEWDDTQSYDWNRARIRDSLRRFSTKGADISIEMLLREHGGLWWNICDQASRLDCWNRQGGWNSPNGFVLDANKWHDGSYVLSVDSNLDFDAFLADFVKIQRAGTIWYFNRQMEPSIGELQSEGSLNFDCSQVSQSKDWQGLFLNWEADGYTAPLTSHPNSNIYSISTPWEGEFWNSDQAFRSFGCFTTKASGNLFSMSVPWRGDYWNWEDGGINEITSKGI